jgi:hypothetical protein
VQHFTKSKKEKSFKKIFSKDFLKEHIPEKGLTILDKKRGNPKSKVPTPLIQNMDKNHRVFRHIL